MWCDLGPFGRGQMKKPFEYTTYALKVGEISDIIDTDSGAHITLWKGPEGRIISNTTREAIISQLKDFHDDIIFGKSKFKDVTSRFSDYSSAKCSGDLGPFGRGQMKKPFEYTTYALKVGEISDIIDTDSGAHIIMRTG
ncbi:hypothetical protein K7X08_000142 [Anisodus acutangulus]|uniref:Peptidyl-prolyl cis-trans isomerase n=1 Tax=Anisodus acutangulus TaxID=402998 RepID=A0A9Q1M2X6_9SOLA|nr:hypothetical protein K7X08_000142 [Anisodus acutangulus]